MSQRWPCDRPTIECADKPTKIKFITKRRELFGAHAVKDGTAGRDKTAAGELN